MFSIGIIGTTVVLLISLFSVQASAKLERPILDEFQNFYWVDPNIAKERGITEEDAADMRLATNYVNKSKDALFARGTFYLDDRWSIEKRISYLNKLIESFPNKKNGYYIFYIYLDGGVSILVKGDGIRKEVERTLQSKGIKIKFQWKFIPADGIGVLDLSNEEVGTIQ